MLILMLLLITHEVHGRADELVEGTSSGGEIAKDASPLTVPQSANTQCRPLVHPRGSSPGSMLMYWVMSVCDRVVGEFDWARGPTSAACWGGVQ